MKFTIVASALFSLALGEEAAVKAQAGGCPYGRCPMAGRHAGGVGAAMPTPSVVYYTVMATTTATEKVMYTRTERVTCTVTTTTTCTVVKPTTIRYTVTERAKVLPTIGCEMEQMPPAYGSDPPAAPLGTQAVGQWQQDRDDWNRRRDDWNRDRDDWSRRRDDWNRRRTTERRRRTTHRRRTTPRRRT